jgi:hypothetical protein
MTTRRKPDVKPIPPKSTDLKGWQDAISAGHLSEFSLNVLAAAIQDLGPDVDVQVRNALAKTLHDAIFRILRKEVGFNHANQGLDIIHRTIYKLFAALSTPGSCDGNAMRKSCYALVKKRMIDAILEEKRERRIPDEFSLTDESFGCKEIAGYLDGEPGDVVSVIETEHSCKDVGGGTNDDNSANNNGEAGSRSVANKAPLYIDPLELKEEEISHLLENAIPDNLKRLAFRLYMEDVPSKTKDEKTHSIAKAVGKDEKTVRIWIRECIDILKVKVSQK